MKKEKWWVANVAICQHIAEYTYGPGHYTGNAFITLFDVQEKALQQIYDATINAYATTGDTDPNYRPSIEEGKRNLLRELKRDGYTIKYNGNTPRIEFGQWRNRGSICLDIKCLNDDGTRSFTREKHLMTELLKQLTT